MTIHNNKQIIENKVTSALKSVNRDIDSVTIIAVTKYVDIETMTILYNEGISNFGENRSDVFLNKYNALSNRKIVWHYIGNLQRRKVKDVINKIDYFHALDSIKLAEEIDKRAEKKIKCFLQVNISEENSKHGFLMNQIDEAVEVISKMNQIEIVGLMTMAPLGADVDLLASIFSRAYDLKVALAARNIPNMPFTELSMGMSNDFELALNYGATYVRIGTAFFE